MAILVNVLDQANRKESSTAVPIFIFAPLVALDFLIHMV
jgi:hypothetical protein